MPDAQITDEELMSAIRQDDYISYNKLFTRYYVSLCQYVYGFILNTDDTKDIVQELFLNLWDKRNRISISENVSGYLYKMAMNYTLNHIRGIKNHQTLIENQDNPLAGYEDNQLEVDEFQVALYDCIELLPARSREVLLLHRIKGLRQKEIAEKLTISVKTIKNQLWTSLIKLRKCLELKGI